MPEINLLMGNFLEVSIYVITSILLILIGFGIGYYAFHKKYEKTGKSAQKIIEDAKRLADENRKNMLVETKQEIYRLKQESEKEIRNLRNEVEREIRERRRIVDDLERKLAQREERLDARSANLDKREEVLNLKEQKNDERKSMLDEQYSKVEELIEEQSKKLLEISGLDIEEARSIILQRVEDEMANEIALLIKDAEDKAKAEVSRKAQSLLANAIQQYASETVSEKTISVVPLPNDEMKGRIIGREGRNIRAIEANTGVDIIIDDTPEAVVLSCFDPIRREIARRTLEALIADGRIQPSRIEELVAKSKKEMDNELRETGEKAVFETGIGRVHPEIIKLIGRLKFRTSYGQNALSHSLEVAFLSGKLAAEIGENEILARRAGLLHDIGKAADHEMEGSHVDIGLELAQKYREHPVVIDAIGSHHSDREPKTIIAQLVAAADTLSAARPGARSESLENYIKRLTKLEDICNEFKGVDKSYALQAGREIRILVKPEEIDDVQAYKLARDIRLKVENDLHYPGTIKVTVIRETRVHEIAK
ncbi:MAG: ribonuclease Y [Bacillota bacterium]|jgi:ribonuclease Y|nr:ribonuclease Y [Bacillota bacterium]HOA77881.1 ribonuclease Y [Bacilli bacterium]HPZ27579.1 ribonuclease Y [Bacilli bacterium]HQC88885.1 ribonuclease Y [Bacilli bacterium]